MAADPLAVAEAVLAGQEDGFDFFFQASRLFTTSTSTFVLYKPIGPTCDRGSIS